MNRRFTPLMIMALILVRPGSAGAVDARQVTLSEALDLARHNAPAAVRALGDVRTGEASMRSAWSAFIPGLSLSAGATRQIPAGAGTRIENGTVITLPPEPWSHSASLNANVTLFEGGRRILELRRARAGLTAAEANERWQRYLVDLNVKQQFFNVLAARESEAAAQAQLQQAQQQLRMATLRLRAATATKSDSLRSEIQMSNARIALTQAATDLATSNAALTRASGAAEPITAAHDAELPVDLAVDEQQLEQWAHEGPQVRVAEADLAAARASRLSSFTDYLPTVSASYGRSLSGEGFFFEGNDPSYNGSFRLSASYPIFNQHNREEQVARAGVAQDNAEAVLRDARLAAREDLTRFLGAFRAAGERVAAQTTSVAAAEEDLRVQQQRYSLGEGTLLDVLTSQTQLNGARAALIRARYDQRIARAQLEALVARDL